MYSQLVVCRQVGGWTQVVMGIGVWVDTSGDGGIGVWVDTTHMYICITWCTLTECLFFFISSHCSESGPVCGVSLN